MQKQWDDDKIVTEWDHDKSMKEKEKIRCVHAKESSTSSSAGGRMGVFPPSSMLASLGVLGAVLVSTCICVYTYVIIFRSVLQVYVCRGKVNGGEF